MVSSAVKKKLGWLEIGLYLGGVLLLAVFFQVRSSGDRQAEEGIRIFQESVAVAQQAGRDEPEQTDAKGTAEWQPNQELWDGRGASRN